MIMSKQCSGGSNTDFYFDLQSIFLYSCSETLSIFISLDQKLRSSYI